MKDFLGTSLAFPFRPDGRGGLALSVGVEAVEDSIRAILSSLKGSHVMEPFLGLPSFVFNSIPNLGLISVLMRDAIVFGDDRVDPDSIAVEAFINDEGEMLITVTYKIKNDATERTLQFGFRLPA